MYHEITLLFTSRHFPGTWTNMSDAVPAETSTADFLANEYPEDGNWTCDLNSVVRRWPSWAWPGGYPIYNVTHDGEALCVACSNEHFDRTMTDGDEFQVIDQDINYEDSSLYCCHCNKRIPSAYAEDDVDGEGQID